MRALKVAVVVMGVLIVLGVAALGVALTRLVFQAPGAGVATVLDEPIGTRIVASSATADRVTLQLTGGGPDRVVVWDLRSGRVAGRVSLPR